MEVDGEAGRVYEHGWQSWSPSAARPVGGVGWRPHDALAQVMGYRPGVRLAERGFQGEGLLAVEPAPGERVTVYAAETKTEIPSIRAELVGDELHVSADGPVEEHVLDGPLEKALGTWADGFAKGIHPRPAPTVWCSWYQYYADVTEADVIENLEAIGEHDLPVDVIQIDDGWQPTIGDWTFTQNGVVERIRSDGRRAGIWVAPFLAGSSSELAKEHPDWLLEPIGPGWHQEIHPLDLRNPGAAAYIKEVFERLAGMGFDYFKLDFLFTGAIAGLAAYEDALRMIRQAVGPEAYLVGCGAPILPSVGLVDAMRVGPDIAPHYEPLVDDMSAYSQRAATLTTVGRAWQHGRFWVNDPDCLLARPAMERREDWATIVRRYGGLRASSDRIADLDEWGLAVTRELLSTTPGPQPLVV